MDLFRKIDALLDDGEADTFRVEQIKEKFGSLRVYVTLADHYDVVGDIHHPTQVVTVTVPSSSRDTPRPSKLDVIQGYIDEAAVLTKTTCEICGQPGQRRSGGWIRTLCDQHAADLRAGHHHQES